VIIKAIIIILKQRNQHEDTQAASLTDGRVHVPKPDGWEHGHARMGTDGNMDNQHEDTQVASLTDGNMDTEHDTHIIHIQDAHSPPLRLDLTTSEKQQTQ